MIRGLNRSCRMNHRHRSREVIEMSKTVMLSFRVTEQDEALIRAAASEADLPLLWR